jgi:hypothetical protein
MPPAMPFAHARAHHAATDAQAPDYFFDFDISISISRAIPGK